MTSRILEYLKIVFLGVLIALLVICVLKLLRPEPVISPLPVIMTNINNALREKENAKTSPDRVSTNRADNVAHIRDMLKRIYR